MNDLVKIVLIRLLGYSVIGGDAYPDFLDKNQPIGLESIKGYIEENCDYSIEVEIIDLHQEDWHHYLREIMIYKESDMVAERSDSKLLMAAKDMFDKLELADFDVIGLSAPMSSEKTLRFFLSFLTGEPDYKDKVIVVGNLISTFCYEQILEDYPTVFCCVGNGEVCMLSLSNYCKGKKAKKRKIDADGLKENLASGETMIPNLFFSYQGVAQKSKECSQAGKRAMFFCPSVSTQKMVEARGGSMRAQSSRGCNFHCGFCVVNSVFGVSGRIEFPVEYVLGYIQKIVANSNRNEIRIDFIDDEFLGHPIDIDRMMSIFVGIQSKVDCFVKTEILGG